MSAQTDHSLLIWPEPFAALWDGRKTYEVRRDDRGFEVGHTLALREWCPQTREYTGRAVYSRVAYMTPGGNWGLPQGLCVMAVREIGRAA